MNSFITTFCDPLKKLIQLLRSGDIKKEFIIEPSPYILASPLKYKYDPSKDVLNCYRIDYNDVSEPNRPFYVSPDIEEIEVYRESISINDFLQLELPILYQWFEYNFDVFILSPSIDTENKALTLRTIKKQINDSLFQISKDVYRDYPVLKEVVQNTMTYIKGKESLLSGKPLKKPTEESQKLTPPLIIAKIPSGTMTELHNSLCRGRFIDTETSRRDFNAIFRNNPTKKIRWTGSRGELQFFADGLKSRELLGGQNQYQHILLFFCLNDDISSKDLKGTSYSEKSPGIATLDKILNNLSAAKE